jgi:hypothetical protein
MVKRFRLFIMAIVTLLVVPVSMVAMAPASAEAGINSVVWLDTAYKGDDPLLGTNVQAYEAGSTAVLHISIQNTTGDNITVKGAKVKLDWAGGEYAATTGNYPTTLADDESGTATISFKVPEISAASNEVKHSYSVSVDYDKEGGFKVGTQIGSVLASKATGYTWSYYLPCIDPATLRVYEDGVLTTGYQLNCDDWSITFNDLPYGGTRITAEYQLAEEVGVGNGANTVYYLHDAPVVSGTERVYEGCTLSSSYTLDCDTGKIEFSTAPEAGKSILANYQYLERWTSGGDDFAVYSADQNAVMAAKQQLEAMGTPGVSTAGSRELLAKSAMERQLGDQQYASGNMEEARGHYEQAFTYLDKALKNDKDPNTFKALEPVGTLLLGIGMLLLALGVVVYVIRKPKGPSSV